MISKLLLFSSFVSILYIKCDNECSKTICNPTAGDLLIGRESFLKASSTCGLQIKEKYCVVTLKDRISEPKCSVCYSKDPYNTFSSPNSHRIENVVSQLPQDPGRWWQSTNGIHNTSIEVAFETEFQLIFTQLRFKTYRPAAMYIERSKDYGINWQKAAYFSDNCARDFPNIPERNHNDIDEVSCTSEFSSISPSEDGTILFVATPSDLQGKYKNWIERRDEITAITNLRVQFIRLHTFGDWKIDNNPNIFNKYYYAISEWIIRGRCSCNGHASTCKPKNGQVLRNEMVYGICVCQHNTMGTHCQKCKDFFNDKPWLPAANNATNECKKCECNNHSTSCHFNPVVFDMTGRTSGGICDSCLDNTEGRNCERCSSGYYRNSMVPLSSSDTCLKCKCDPHGTIHPSLCIQESEPDLNLVPGSCVCKENVDGFYCDRCKTGFWNFQKSNEKGCTECTCLMIGTINGQGCDSTTGRCFCKSFVDGQLCNTCKEGYYNLSASNPFGCDICGCSLQGSYEYGGCDKYSGQCKCRLGYSGRTCDQIKDGWFIDSPRYQLRLNKNVPIELPPVSKSGYYNFIITTDTQQMVITDTFMVILSIDHNIRSSCPTYQDTIPITKDSRNIVVPNKCLVEDLPIIISVFIIIGPSDQSLAPSIVDVVVVPMLSPSSSDTRATLAECLKYHPDSVPAKCNFLKAEISSRTVSNSEPKTCQCNVTGSVNGICNKFVGQCNCLPNVKGRQCDECSMTSYGFDARGCKSCDCDAKGSLNLRCASDTGQCICRIGVQGRHCNYCKKGFWRFPFCEPCKCHSMTDTCDQKTGQCLNCRGNSFGFNCQQCNNGYYGDPSKNMPCLRCHCPGLGKGINNALKCSLIFNTTSYMCVCKPGFKGQFCDECDNNYFGNPREKNGVCRPCHCSSNIDRNIPGSCDARTGECKKCQYNTAGFNCEKCAPGYFGLGVTRTCKRCVCNELGTDLSVSNICHHETGRCPCLPNVVGLNCDKCSPKFYHLASGKGCLPCDCESSNGAITDTCNSLTGQCQCRESRSGRQCDKCQDSYWGDPLRSNGCKVCLCNREGSLFNQCDRNNGACRCRPGIAGRYCDQCARGTDGKMPNCSLCGDCWIQWDDNINHLITSMKKLENGTMQNMSTVGIPPKLLIIIDNITKMINFIQLMLNFSPINLTSQLNRLQFKLAGLRYELENLDILNFNSNEFDPSDIIKLIGEKNELVANNKIRDVEGAYNVIVKSLKSVIESLYTLKVERLKIETTRKVIQDRNKQIGNINLDTLERKSNELNNLEKTLEKNLDTFNGVTCNSGQNKKIDPCSDPCGAIGCQTNNCFRWVNINSQCVMSDSLNFFNAQAWRIDKRKLTDTYFKEMELKLGKNITGKLNSSDTDIGILKRLVEMTNVTVNENFKLAIKLLETLKFSQKMSVSENEFKKLLLEIRSFRLSSHEHEITNLEKEIKTRIQLLADKVTDVLTKSKETGKECDLLKISATEAKNKASNLLKSIKDLEENHKKIGKLQNEIRNLLLYFDFYSLQIIDKLNEIMKNQNETGDNHIKMNQFVKIIKLLKVTIGQMMKTVKDDLDKLENGNANMVGRLQKIRKRIEMADLKKTLLIKDNYMTTIRNEGKRQEMFENIKQVSRKIVDAREKIAAARQSITNKQAKLQILQFEVENRLQRLSNLENEIFAKTEFQESCLP